MKKELLILLCATISLNSVAQINLSQKQCREMAISTSEDLHKAENKVEQAKLDFKIANTAYLPNIEGSATGAFVAPNIDMMGMDLIMRGTYMAGISLAEPIYTGGKITTGRKLAKVGQSVAKEQHRKTKMEVIAEADNNYWSYIAVRSKVAMLKSYLCQMDTLYNQTQTAVEIGMAIKNDLLRISAKKSEITYQLQKAIGGENLCRLSLCRVIGVEPSTAIEPTDTTIMIGNSTPLSVDISERPELKLLEEQVSASKLQVRMAKADMLPTLGLSIGYTYYGNIKLKSMVDVGGGVMMPYKQEFRDGMGVGMLALKVPIFHWGEARKKVSKARYDYSNAQLDLEKNSKLLTLEVEQAINNLECEKQMLHSAEQGLEQAEENLRVMRERYNLSMAPLTDLLDAQSQWQSAKSNLIEAQTQYKIYETDYLKASGKLIE